MFINHLAIVSQSALISFDEVLKISAALQKQITRDFTPIWGIPASIDPFQNLSDIPPGYWPIIIKDNIGFPGAAGIHLDHNGQPYALVQAGLTTSLTCSHEMAEILADPFGNRFVASQSIKSGQGRVKYLVEVCDPSEGKQFAYTINGVIVSDFYTPHYFDPVKAPSIRYSYTGAIMAPKQVLKDGYLSWMVPETGEWFQATFFGSSLIFKSLGKLAKTSGKSWREMIDTKTFEPVKKLIDSKKKLTRTALTSAFSSPAIEKASNGWAEQLEYDISKVIKEAQNLK